MNIAIIEDEVHIANRLEEILLELIPQVSIHKRIGSIQEGLDFFATNPPLDLIFSDIELLDGQSFEIFRLRPQSTPIIFCTAFDEYALKAFEVNGIDYILKPFSKERISETLDKYQRLVGSTPLSKPDSMDALLQLLNRKKSGRILAQKGEKTIPITYADIAIVQLENGMVYLHHFDGQRYHVNQKLEALENTLGAEFYRLNRQVLIQRNAVAHTTPCFARKLKVSPTIDFDGELLVSKAGVSAFLNWLQG